MSISFKTLLSKQIACKVLYHLLAQGAPTTRDRLLCFKKRTGRSYD